MEQGEAFHLFEGGVVENEGKCATSSGAETGVDIKAIALNVVKFRTVSSTDAGVILGAVQTKI